MTCSISGARCLHVMCIVFSDVVGKMRKGLNSACFVQVNPQASQARNTWCMGQLVYIESCMGKSPIVKNCINISFEIKFSYLECVAYLFLVLILKSF